jgi:site-specific DNA-methyltransferase (adenine-specific)
VILPRNQILAGDAAKVLARLLPESVDCVITSPPYFRQRDYGVPGQLGQEATITEYVARLRRVCRGIRRVLKPHGSAFFVVGDTYARQSGRGVPVGSRFLMPERVALMLAASSWCIRNVCVWHKPNPLPESVRDRLSSTYEVVIFATKQRRYLFDLDAIRIPHRSAGRARPRCGPLLLYQGANSGLGALKATGRVGHPHGKNPGDVWTIPTANDRLGHQATFPEALIEPLLLASCPERICVQCDRAWTRPTRIVTTQTSEGPRHTRRVGELRRCGCFAPARPGVVLDPFLGTGTTAVVAERHHRDWLGIELSERYRALAAERLSHIRRTP